MKTLAKFKFRLTRLALLVLCLAWLAPQAHADVTIWVYGTNANAVPHLEYWGATATNVSSGAAMTPYEYQGTTWYYMVLHCS